MRLGKMERSPMQAPQLAGFAVTVAVVLGVDLPIDWLVFVATLAGGLAMFAVAHVLNSRR